MTGAEKLEAIFAGEMVDRVPFALKGWRIPKCQMEQRLLDEGMCILDARSVYGSKSPNVETETQKFSEAGVDYTRAIIRTPRGELSNLSQGAGGAKTERTSWRLEFLFKGPEDYAAVEFMIRDRQYFPSYEGFLKAQEEVGDMAYFKTGAPGCPMHDIMYGIMGLETFSIEWAERRDQVLKLHDAIAENQRQVYPIVAQSPAKLVQCGGNYSPEVLGKQRFVDFVLPHWEEAAGILHEEGKMLGCHLDANNALWAKEVGDSPLDWIEAFTPAPDTDMTMAQARAAWPEKVQFINFPSSVHLASAEVIADTTRQLLREVAPGDRFVVGITENVPENRWRESFHTILTTLNECGQLPIDPNTV